MKVIDQINESGIFAQSAYSAATAINDGLGREITSTYLTGLPAGTMNESNFGYDSNNKISGYNGSAFAGEGGGGIEYSAGDHIGIVDDTISVTGIKDLVPGTNVAIEITGDSAVISCTGIPSLPESANWEATYDVVSSNSADWNSAAGMNELPVSAGQGMDIQNVDGNIVFSCTGGSVPEGVMVESGLEYNAVNEISAYNGSAIAQYGAEKQWLVHDDTLVHIANSAQYALGVNVSAVAQLMGTDETVLWEGTLSSTNAMQPFKVSDEAWKFDHLRFYWNIDGNYTISESYVASGAGTRRIVNEYCWFANSSYYTCKSVLSAYNDDVSGAVMQFIDSIKYQQSTSSPDLSAFYHNWTWSFTPLKKIVGIGRKA